MLLGNVDRQPLVGLVVQRRADERDEQRVRPGRPALELGVRLGADDERMDVGGVLDELDQVPVRRRAGEPQPALGDAVAVGVVDLVAVPVPLGHLGGLIGLRHNRIRLQHRRIGAQPHGAAEVGLAGDRVALVGHRGDHRIGRLRDRTPRSWRRRGRPSGPPR